jgi:glutathione synthase/RimK-type ligase-like ATP-grasp enzyme
MSSSTLRAAVNAFVLMFSLDYDPHATAVAWALRQNGVPYRLNPSLRVDASTRLCVHADEHGDTLALDDIDMNHVRAVWHRRPRTPAAGACLEADRGFIEGQWKYLQKNIFDAAEDAIDALWINRPRAAEHAESKLVQLRAARAAGLSIPETMISNRASDVARLIRRWGRVVFKTFYPQSWEDSGKRLTYQMSTAMLDAGSELPEQAIAVSPGIFQRYIDKSCDVRVTFIGERIFAIKIDKASGDAYFDWRAHSHDADTRIEIFELGTALEAKLRDVMRRLDLVFGCIDLVIDRDGQGYFLEINQAGQFLFVEERMPELKLLRAMTGMLIAGNTHYAIGDSVDVRLKDYLDSDEYRQLGSVVRDTGQRVAQEVS